MKNGWDGGPAFPEGVAVDNSYGLHFSSSPGLSIRDYFAGQALAGMLADPTSDGTKSQYASDAYAYADAMLKAREK